MIRILMVDDTRSVHAFLKAIFSKVPETQCQSAMNGSEALSIVNSGAQFDIILLDWEMPILNGPQTLEALKKANCGIPVMMMTTKNNPQDIQEMIELGACEYLMKPFTPDILIEKLKFILGDRFSYAA